MGEGGHSPVDHKIPDGEPKSENFTADTITARLTRHDIRGGGIYGFGLMSGLGGCVGPTGRKGNWEKQPLSLPKIETQFFGFQTW